MGLSLVDEREHVIFNMVNGLLLRPYVSGIVWNMSEESMAIFREGISTYKKIRSDLKTMVPFFPLGFGRVNDAQLAYGVRGRDKAYLSVFAIRNGEAEIPLEKLGTVRNVNVIYPASGDCSFTVRDGVLKVQMPAETCARLFEITLG